MYITNRRHAVLNTNTFLFTAIGEAQFTN